MKLRKLYIDDYKMFKDFDISFVDENDEALPIVVLAGVNGSGKTTLLEFFDEDFLELSEVDIEYVEYENIFGTIINTNQREIKSKFFRKAQKIRRDKKNGIIYLRAGIDEIKNISDEFVKTFYFYLKEKDYRPSEVKDHFDKYMKDIFDGLDLTFNYSHLDKEDNVWFTNDNGKEFEIKDLSTGEKTLLSKILYIYFKDYKDKVILIDEPELSLHPSWQNKILSVYEKLAKKNNCQIIIATHSPHIIVSAKNEYLRILRKDEEGNIKVVSGLKAEGRDINSALFDVMDETAYRPQKFRDMIDKLFIEIDSKNLEEANKQLDVLKKSYGEEDSTIIEAQMLIDMFSAE